MIPGMADQPRKKIGRPSKGDRVVTWVRLPRATREAAERIAAQSGLPVSDVVAALVSLGLDHQADLQLSQQEELLLLTKAS